MAYTAQEVVDDVRFFIGNVDCEFVNNQEIYEILLRFEPDVTRPDDLKCSVTYRTVIETLRYLIRNYQSKISSGQVATTAPIAEIEEEVGKRRKKIKYATSTSSNTTSTTTDWKSHWKDLLEYYTEEGMSSIGCSSTVTGGGETTGATGGIVIGGASVNGYQNAIDTRGRFEQAKYHNPIGGGSRPWRY